MCYLFSNGLSFSLSEHISGVRFILHSSNSWLPIATQKLLEGFRTFKVDPKRLDVKKEELKRHWQNFSLGKPFDISDGLVRYLLSAPPSPDDKRHQVRLIWGNGLSPELWPRVQVGRVFISPVFCGFLPSFSFSSFAVFLAFCSHFPWILSFFSFLLLF